MHQQIIIEQKKRKLGYETKEVIFTEQIYGLFQNKIYPIINNYYFYF